MGWGGIGLGGGTNNKTWTEHGQTNTDTEHGQTDTNKRKTGLCVCVCVCARVRVRVRACMRTCVCWDSEVIDKQTEVN